MTLRKLLIIVTVSIFLLGYLGTGYLSVRNFHIFLEHALQQQLMNTVNSLAFSLSQPGQQDKAYQETIINAVFEPGDYHEITLTNTSNTVLLSRTNAAEPNMPPAWFTNMFTLHVPPAAAIVSNGWTQTGTIYVVPELGHAYKQLWNSSKQIALWFICLLLGTILLELFAVHLLLKPLDAIKQLAQAIIDKKFTLVKEMPFTHEFRQVVKVMNRLSSKVQTIFEEQSAVIEQLRDKVYKDTITKLGNRRYFNMQLDALLAQHDHPFQGALLILEFKNFAQYKKQQGYELAELYLVSFADLILAQTNQYIGAIAARLDDNAFAFLLPSCPPPQTLHFAKALKFCINQLQLPGSQEIIYNIGVSIYKPTQTRSEFLAAADLALRAAQLREPNSYYLDEAVTIESTYFDRFNKFKALLEKNLDEKSFTLYFQPAFGFIQNQLHPISLEALFRLNDEGQFVSGGEFLNQLDKHELITRLDKAVITKVITLLTQNTIPARVAINIAISSIIDQGFHDWLSQQLTTYSIGHQLSIELPENMVTQYIEPTQNFIDKFRKFGCEFTLDEFGKGFNSFRYLRKLDIQSVKITSGLTKNILENTEDQFYVRTLIDIAHNLDIKVIAKTIEHKDVQDLLLHLGADSLQGYLYAKPAPLAETLQLLEKLK